MILSIRGCTFFPFFLLLFWGCSSEPSDDRKPDSGDIELTDVWARPGSQGSASSVYFQIYNGREMTDTLREVSSGEAGMAELHESFEDEEGISEMRRVENLVINPGERVHLQPAGLHIMLMELTRDLTPGDSVEITLEFVLQGEKSLTVPVQMQP